MDSGAACPLCPRVFTIDSLNILLISVIPEVKAMAQKLSKKLSTFLYTPQENGILIESMDACFGLARRKRPGQTYDVPKHGTLFFADQCDIDNFIDTHSQKAEDVKEVK